MNILDIIQKKINKISLSKEEINDFVNGYTNGQIKDYQISALLMTILFNGMSDNETAWLTEAMMNSGEIMNLDQINGIVVDKHSTGGVGDKISLIFAPIVAVLGGKVGKMSGRGLGHTGGTIDKLETIKGFHTSLSKNEFITKINKHGLAIMSQSSNITPADKKLYALRDVTGTVSSMPLIIASIMSKKLATGSQAILLDVKCGNGAFMTNINDATLLGEKMIMMGKTFGRDVRVCISDMSKPLGRAIGNKIEIVEAIQTLKGNGPNDLTELAINLAATSLIQAKKYKNKKLAIVAIKEVIKSGKALKKFYEFISSQNGDVSILKSSKFFNPKYKKEIIAKHNGIMKITSAINFGVSAMNLGAGRKKKEDNIDPEAGIFINKKTGEMVKLGDVVITLYSSKPITDESIVKMIQNSYKLLQEKEYKKSSIILKEME